jgi:predicted transposase YbfD/YdcC
MLAKSEKEFIELFNTVEDPREDERTLYPLSEILFLAISGVLSCAESWREIIRYGRMNIDFLRTYFPYNNGIPSKSLLSRVLGAIDKKQMEQFLIEFAAWFYKIDREEIIAVDGKKIKGSDIHLLHVLATKCGIVLAQVDIDNKHNESTAIPDVLERLNIAGAVVTADALNCQKAIAEKIRAKDADYFLSLKGNQGTLFSETKNYFEDKKKYDYAEDINKEHGRLEVRRCWSTDDIDWLKECHNGWKDLKSICCVERERIVKGKTSIETAYYISSTPAMASKHLNYSRKHLGVESMHWVLDVVFNEDRTSIGAKNAAQNMAIIRKLVINMIKRYKQATGDETAIKTLRKVSSWSSAEAAKILKFMVANMP